LRRRADARRIILRIDRERGGLVLTFPPHTSQRVALDFAASQAPWILARIERCSERIPLCAGTHIPLRGLLHEIQPARRRGTVKLIGEPEPAIMVPGDERHPERRLIDWLKRQAAIDLAQGSRKYAARLGVSFARIVVRDTTSRWGSCSASGNLSYNWRLVLAPPFVLDYVTAHEVTHLAEMNHGPRFWSIVEALCPETGNAWKWLRAHGSGLHLYGQNS
jgi:predicted metal-dependent hydrolase